MNINTDPNNPSTTISFIADLSRKLGDGILDSQQARDILQEKMREVVLWEVQNGQTVTSKETWRMYFGASVMLTYNEKD